MRLARSATLLALATALACAPKPPAAPPPPDAATIRTAIDAQLAVAVSAAKQRNAVAVAAIFTDDATQIAPDATITTGRASIQKSMEAQFNSAVSVTIGPYSIDRLLVVSDSEAVAISHGAYTLTMKDKKPESRINKFVDVWTRGTDGAWRVAYEINADGPSTETGPPMKP